MRLVILLALLVLFAIAIVLWMAGGVQRPKVTQPSVLELPGVSPRPRTATRGPEDLVVVTWNIAWGSVGSGGAKPKEHFDRTLEEMGRVLRSFDPDVVLLQEVDFDCDRSHRQDQAEALARTVELPFVAKAVSWEAPYIPFPYWPPEDHFGTMRSGGAILSRFPLADHRVQTVAKPDENPWWYNLFYLFRYYQQATLQMASGPVRLFNLHTDAFSQENRIQQARIVAEQVSRELLPRTVVGGDFNTVPPEATQRSGYADEPDNSHVDDPTLEIIRGVQGLVDTVPGPAYLENEEAWFTFPAHEPNRKLDYLMYGAGYRVVSVEVPRGLAGDLSDHLPLVVHLAPIETATTSP
ncbi:MAG: endonuclease/exonuclease/phosphatase family protein [Myxococcota bacterium]